MPSFFKRFLHEHKSPGGAAHSHGEKNTCPGKGGDGEGGNGKGGDGEGGHGGGNGEGDVVI